MQERLEKYNTLSFLNQEKKGQQISRQEELRQVPHPYPWNTGNHKNQLIQNSSKIMLQLLKFQSALPHSIVILDLLICNPCLVTNLSFGLRLKKYNDQSAEISKSLNKHYYNPTKGILRVSTTLASEVILGHPDNWLWTLTVAESSQWWSKTKS